MMAITAMREKIGFTNSFIHTLLDLKSEFECHHVIKDAVLRLVKTLLIDYQPYASWIGNKLINVYIWKTMGDF